MKDINAERIKNNLEAVKLLPHNQEMYDGIVEKMDNGYHSIFYSEATGLGKSFIFMKLMEKRFQNKKVLYIVPKIAIWNNLNMYKEFKQVCNKVDMSTNAAFNDESVVDLYADMYDVVFVDEAHHLESDVQGPNIVKLINRIVANGGYAFGMTATPYVKGIFIDEKYFEASVYGNNLADAITKGLFPKIKYELGVPDILEVPDDVKLQFNVDSTKPLLEQIIDEHKDIKHWLAFFTTTAELEDNEVQLRKLFPGFKIFKMHSAMGQSEEELQEFNEYEGDSILMSVSMLLEGVHLKHCEGVLLYRNVKTDNTMFQIIGRLCKANSNISPLFIDITNSIIGIKSLFADKHPSRDVFNHVVLKLNDPESRREVLICSQKTTNTFDLLQVLENNVVHEYRGIKWTTTGSLERVLGMYSGNLVRWLKADSMRTCEQYIDFRLGPRSYEEYVADGYNIYVEIKEYRGITWNTSADLCRKLGRYESDYRTRVFHNPDYSVSNYIDEQLKDSTYEEYVADGYVGKYKCLEYRYTSKVDLANQIGCTVNILNHRISRHLDWSLEEVITDILQSKKSVSEYKGFKIGLIKELTQELGVDVSAYSRFIKHNPDSGFEEFIDYCIGDAKDKDEYYAHDKNKVYRYKDKVWINKMDLAKVLGISASCLHKYLSSGYTIPEFIDFVEANPDKFLSKKSGTIGSIVFSSVESLSRKLGYASSTLSTKVKRFGSLEQAAEHSLHKISQETGIQFSNLDELAEHFGTTTDAINDWLDKNNASIKDYIDMEMNR